MIRVSRRALTVFAATVFVLAFPAGAKTLAVEVGSSARIPVPSAMKRKGTVKIKSSKPAVAAVVGGKIVGKEAGTAAVTIKAGGKKLRLTVEVSGPAPEIRGKKRSVKVGRKLRLKASAANGAKIEWFSFPRFVAEVSENGTVTGVFPGKAVVEAVANGKTASVTIKVKGNYSKKERKARKAVLSMKSRFPEGSAYGPDDKYAWKGGTFRAGYGCAGFAFLLSDRAFKSAPARMKTKNLDVGLRPGDVIRLDGEHSVVVTDVGTKAVRVAQGNLDGKVSWKEKVSLEEIRNLGTYVLTRY